MNTPLKLLFLLIFLPVSGCWSQLTVKRQFQLDSIVSVISPVMKKDAAKVHHYLDSLGKTDEEKVWMFYGFIGTFMHYDYTRFKNFKAPDYSPFTTVNKGSGVCRDFAQLFDFFCTKSNIPCYKVHGKTHVSIFLKIKQFFHGYSSKTNHVWNVVKINGKWQLMDPTWTFIEKKTKVPIYDKKGKLKQTLIIKSVSRTYYNPDPGIMAKTHATSNPAFYLLHEIPVYKKALRKRNKKMYASDFDFQKHLDAHMNERFAEFCKDFDTLARNYSNVSATFQEYNRTLNEPLLKRTPYNAFNLSSYVTDSCFAADLFNYMKTEYHNYSMTAYTNFLQKHALLKEKYIKAQKVVKK